MKGIWRHFRHPGTGAEVRVHVTDRSKARIFQRWGWEEYAPAGVPVPKLLLR